VTATLTLLPTRPAPTTTKPRARRGRAYATTGDIGRRLAKAQALQLQIQALTNELDTHRAWLLTHMQRHNLDHLELGDFTVTRKLRHNWSYSPETEREALALRTTQKWEQSQGLATDTPTAYVAFNTKQPKSAS
jgi:hypothetical protein